jgi:uncharacterized membrane protein YoaK (UPF0700 family)
MTDDRDQRSLLAVLLILTFLSGMVDAVCYLGLGRVFTANMTGNIVILGFAAAGAPGFSVTASLTSLVVFLAGAIVGGRFTQHVTPHSRLLTIAVGSEAVFVGVAAVIASQVATVATGWARFTVIAFLAFAMGIRNAVIRRLAVPDMTTTVLTMTLTGLAADSGLAGGTHPHVARRAAAVVAMVAGAAVGAALFLHVGAGLPLAIAAGLAAVNIALFRSSQAPAYLDQR